MSSNVVIKGKAHKFGDNINTDVHCSNKYTPGLGVEDVAKIGGEDTPTMPVATNLDVSRVSNFTQIHVVLCPCRLQK